MTDTSPTPYEQLFVNNRRWVSEQLALDPEFFERLAEGQQPDFLFIGCSDSRVNANEITGTGPGEMFIHRNIANLVVHTDMNLMSVLQFAVEVLHVNHVIVCGHYGCGGVRAAVDGHYHGLIDKWLRSIKDVYRIYQRELDAIADPEARHRRLVELNVREQVYKVSATSFVQRAWHHERDLHVHGWVYDLHEGLLRDLHVDPEHDFDSARIYEYDDL
ncbi:MAG: carbonic anhydrase [Acidimicrobiales bacterium]